MIAHLAGMLAGGLRRWWRTATGGWRVPSEVPEMSPPSHLETQMVLEVLWRVLGCLEYFHLCGVQFSGWNQIL